MSFARCLTLTAVGEKGKRRTRGGDARSLAPREGVGGAKRFFFCVFQNKQVDATLILTTQWLGHGRCRTAEMDAPYEKWMQFS